MVVSHEIDLKERPVGMPTNRNFKLVEVQIPEPSDGEFLVRNIWMSVDPYMRGRMTERKSYVPPFELGKPLEGGCVAKVVESKNNQFAVGDCVLGMKGCREYWISDGNPASGVTKIDPNMGPIQLFLGIYGMTGLTASSSCNARIARAHLEVRRSCASRKTFKRAAGAHETF